MQIIAHFSFHLNVEIVKLYDFSAVILNRFAELRLGIWRTRIAYVSSLFLFRFRVVIVYHAKGCVQIDNCKKEGKKKVSIDEE